MRIISLPRLLLLVALATVWLLAGARTLSAQAQQTTLQGTNETPPAADPVVPPAPADETKTTFLPHPESGRFWVGGQANIILQWHPRFDAKYSGVNSLPPAGENATSRVLTLYLGYALTRNTEILLDVESAGGKGIGAAFGLAGFTNLDVVRNPTLGDKPYIARGMIRQIIPLSRDRVAVERGPLGLRTDPPARRLELRLGKIGIVDFFDLNAVGGDSHSQFLNWGVDNNGGYDYAADTRGYTFGAMVEYYDRHYELRFAEVLMPKIANGIHLDADLARAHSENMEATLHGNVLRKRESVVRLLSYVNHANMGDYREAVHAFLARVDPLPDLIAHRQLGRIKYGFGMNLEQEITKGLRAYGRWGWNEGRNESFAYTEVNQALSLGAAHSGKVWHRPNDKLGGAFALHSISGDHREYLALGGLGFLLGDGKLTYGRERIFEAYYNVHVWRGAFFSMNVQRITNPGYNRDRGPVLVPGVRLHLEF